MRAIQTPRAPAAIGTYSQAIGIGNTIYLSGQIPLSPLTMELVSPDIAPQIEQVFNNLSAVCQAAGGSLGEVVSVTIYLIHLDHFPLVNEVMARYFSEPFPARVTVGVSALPRAALVEISGIMVLHES
jgi:reactive intermediate/imine deaminase